MRLFSQVWSRKWLLIAPCGIRKATILIYKDIHQIPRFSPKITPQKCLASFTHMSISVISLGMMIHFDFDLFLFTLPETSIFAHENQWFEDELSFWGKRPPDRCELLVLRRFITSFFFQSASKKTTWLLGCARKLGSKVNGSVGFFTPIYGCFQKPY